MKTSHALEAKFGRTFMHHLERLAGHALPTLDFPLDTATLACFVLLTEREAQLKNDESTRRFTLNSLSRNIAELGVPANGNLEGIIRRMEKSGYVRVREDGFLLGETPLSEFCRILDEIFPKMPGLNLVVYLAQTMEEVVSGRKSLDAAYLQLDQVVEMHGVPLPESRDIHGAKKGTPSPSKTSSSPQKEEGRKRPAGKPGKGNRQAMLKLLQAAARKKSQIKTVSSSKLIRPGSTTATDRNEKRMGSPDDSSSEKSLHQEPPIHPHPEKWDDAAIPEGKGETLAETDQGYQEQILPYPSETKQRDDELPDEQVQGISSLTEISGNEPCIEETETKPSEEFETGQGGKAEGEKNGSDDQNSSGFEEGPDQLGSPDGSEQESDLHDKEIEDRIATFEEYLAMTCPLCGKGKIQVRETSKGKRFYECSQDGCYFISWGKPYHLTCPECRNNFLIEAVSAERKKFLKCPRATCNYTQNLPGEETSLEETQKKVGQGKNVTDEKSLRRPKKKVVRRRLVRRKK